MCPVKYPLFLLWICQDGQCAVHYAALSSGNDMLRMVLVELQMDPDSRDYVSAYCTHTSYVHTDSLSLFLRHTCTHAGRHTIAESLQCCVYVSLACSCLHLLQVMLCVFCAFYCVPLAPLPCVYISLVHCHVQEGRTPLMAAAQENKTAAIQILINEAKCDRDAATEVVCVSLFCIILIIIIIIGIFFSYVLSQQGEATAVMFALKYCHPQTARTLLQEYHCKPSQNAVRVVFVLCNILLIAVLMRLLKE